MLTCFKAIKQGGFPCLRRCWSPWAQASLENVKGSALATRHLAGGMLSLTPFFQIKYKACGASATDILF